MRIWSLHPKYLDAKALVALWRETLLAKHVLEGKTKGYINHPQLIRFRNSSSPLGSINAYLHVVYEEAVRRGYKFDKSKIGRRSKTVTIPVTSGQISYEQKHLLAKMNVRDRLFYSSFVKVAQPDVHPIFTVVKGEVETWEVVK